MEPRDTDLLTKFFEKANKAGAVVATIKIEAVPEQLFFERSFVVTRRSMTRLTKLIDELNDEDRLS
jgi:hypothetical protein